MVVTSFHQLWYVLLYVAAQASLGQVLEVHPLAKGLAEIVTYFQIAAESTWADIDGARTQTLSWTTADGTLREATVELITFVRAE